MAGNIDVRGTTDERFQTVTVSGEVGAEELGALAMVLGSVLVGAPSIVVVIFTWCTGISSEVGGRVCAVLARSAIDARATGTKIVLLEASEWLREWLREWLAEWPGDAGASSSSELHFFELTGLDDGVLNALGRGL